MKHGPKGTSRTCKAEHHQLMAGVWFDWIILGIIEVVVGLILVVVILLYGIQ